MDAVDMRKRGYFGKMFTEYLQKWQKENHRTQKEFCAAAGVSKNIVTAWKRGERFPRDAQMQKICEVLGVDQRAFEPFFPLEKQFVYNSNSEYWANLLQQYADEKGLDEQWYQYFISRPNFLRRFPFERPPVVKTTQSEFDCVKFEFEDEVGNRIMMTKGDIDFMIMVQNKSDQMIDYQMYRQKQRMVRKHIENLIDMNLKHFDGLDRNEILSRLYVVDLTKSEHQITDKEVYDTIFQVAEEKGLRPHFSKAEIIDYYITNSTLHDKEWIRLWREYGKIHAKEEEAEEIIRKGLESDRKVAEELIVKFRNAGLLDEETED